VRCSIAYSISLALLASAGPAVAASPPADRAVTSPSREELLARFRAIPGLSAHYREEKTMALLAAPLVSEGELYFVAPGRLARHQTSPTPSSVLVDADQLRFGDAHGSETIDLGSNPVVRLFVQSFVQILAGDAQGLERMYATEYRRRSNGGWTMTLRPKIAPIDSIVEHITVSGHDVVLETMEIVEVGGDRTRTTFTGVDANHEFSRSELRRIFRIRNG
jgi:outer membrane lipoprotein-sorting protein